MPHHIAIVEDESTIAANYRDALQRRGFRVSVYRDRSSASLAFDRGMPDLAIIDVGLGDEVEVTTVDTAVPVDVGCLDDLEPRHVVGRACARIGDRNRAASQGGVGGPR